MRPKTNHKIRALPPDYFRPRDFEYAQPIYDLAFLLQVDALSKKQDVPEYRTFALWKAAVSIDGYTTSVDKWLEDVGAGDRLDCVPTRRITEHLRAIRDTGTIPELEALTSPSHQACLRLRAIRGLGVKHIADALAAGQLTDAWLRNAVQITAEKASTLCETWDGTAQTAWEAAHVIPPLLRLLNSLEREFGADFFWTTTGLGDGLQPIQGTVEISISLPLATTTKDVVRNILQQDHFFSVKTCSDEKVVLAHLLGWKLLISSLYHSDIKAKSIAVLAAEADALLPPSGTFLRGDLHMHTNWSDGAAALQTMAEAAQANGLEYVAITEHSRSCKLQDGLNAVSWLRQAVSLSLLHPKIGILHGIEVDILRDGCLDLPSGLLAGMDIVIGSVHSSWDEDTHSNTERILKAVQSGHIDVLGHATSTILGKPGIPSYYRAPINLDWNRVFETCRKWSVALEFNCFPSRLDLLLPLLIRASSAGCWIAFGSDAHSRAHLVNLNVAQKVLPHIDVSRVLNLLSFKDFSKWLEQARVIRRTAPVDKSETVQLELFAVQPARQPRPSLVVRVAHHESVPNGSRIVGLDLTASKAKPTGVAVLDGLEVKTCSLESDDDIFAFIKEVAPAIVSIDSPLGLPGGGQEISVSAGIVRRAEYDLSSVGIPAYPALIDSMKPLTLRGISLRKEIESWPNAPKVIESYPGAAQDILCIPRKQKGLEFLRSGLRELGLHGTGLSTRSHDEMDAITSAIVGRFYESGEFEPMGIPAEAQLIVPKIQPLRFETPPVICLAGRTGAGKSVVARYLALFYGFHWIKTRELIYNLLIDDIHAPSDLRMFNKPVDEHNITDNDLTEFGIVILEQFRQVPLARKLRETVAASRRPVIVDAVRDLADFEALIGLNRPSILWFIDAQESIIQMRLKQRAIQTSRSPKPASGIDQMTTILKSAAHLSLRNDASLEDLRWRVDDTLFEAVHLERN